MSKHRFRFIATFHEDQRAEIFDEELHHLKKVLRLSVGTEVELMDGTGHSGVGAIEKIGTHSALISLSHITAHKASNRTLHLAIGALKKGDLEDIMPSITEIGIDKVHVFLQEGSAKHLIHESMLERLQKIARSASKQCKRGFFPTVMTYPSLQQVVKTFAEDASKAEIFYCDLAGESHIPGENIPAELKDVMAVVGAEAGLSTEEEEMLHDAGAKALNLGPHVLRAKTAAIVSGFYLQQIYG